MEQLKESIKINDKILQLGVLSDGEGYQLYLYPGMSVAEMAFCHMVTLRLLLKGGYIKERSDFEKLVDKYMTDPQYAPLEDGDAEIFCKDCGVLTTAKNRRIILPIDKEVGSEYICRDCAGKRAVQNEQNKG